MNQTLPPPVVATPTPAKRKRRWPWIAGGVGILAVIAGIAGAGKQEDPTNVATETVTEAPQPDETAPVTDAPVVPETAPVTDAPVVPETTPVTEAPAPTAAPATDAPESNLTPSQQNAVESAESYLDYSSFSRQGLIDQLVYEQFTPEQATYAATQVGL